MDWQDTFKVMKSRDLQPSLLCPVHLSFRRAGKELPRKEKKLKECIITKPVYKMLRGLIQEKE